MVPEPHPGYRPIQIFWLTHDPIRFTQIPQVHITSMFHNTKDVSSTPYLEVKMSRGC
jgi:hypothetical protein